MLIDSHCHLDFPDFAESRGEVVARAERAGIARMITICTRSAEVPAVQAIAEAHPSVYFAAGIHPHEAGRDAHTMDSLAAVAAHPKMVGIGETGLDYFYDNSPREAQQESFRLHIRAARALGLPLIIHTRDAEADTMRLLREEGAGRIVDGKALTGLLHCFSGSAELAEFAIEIGFYISFSGIATFKKAEALRAIAASLPGDRILVETDAPYLAPVPKRGKTNEPAFVAHTAQCLAEVRGQSAADFAAMTTANAGRLFTRLPVPSEAAA